MHKFAVAVAIVSFGLVAIAYVYLRPAGQDSAFDVSTKFPSATESASSPPQNSAELTSTNLVIVPDRIIVPGAASTQLFEDVPDTELDHEVLEEFLAARPIAAYRIVRIDSDSLRALIRESGSGGRIEVQLFESKPIVLIVSEAAEHSAGWQSGLATWRGAVEGDDTSQASFVIEPSGSVNGVIRTLKDGRVKIEPITGTPNHVIWQWNSGFERKID